MLRQFKAVLQLNRGTVALCPGDCRGTDVMDCDSYAGIHMLLLFLSQLAQKVHHFAEFILVSGGGKRFQEAVVRFKKSVWD